MISVGSDRFVNVSGLRASHYLSLTVTEVKRHSVIVEDAGG